MGSGDENELDDNATALALNLYQNRLSLAQHLLLFSNYFEQQIFFCVVTCTCLNHSSLSRQTVAFWSASNFDSSASIEESVTTWKKVCHSQWLENVSNGV